MPDSRRWPTLDTGLAKRIGQADRSPLRTGAWLAEVFGVPLDGPWPAAAATRSIDQPASSGLDLQWLRADPAWIRADINGGKLLAVAETLPMTPEDALAFTPALRTLFEEAGMRFDAPNPHRWYVELAADIDLPEFHGPDLALGDDAFEHLNMDAGARRWKTLMSEAQVVLHQHPRNAVRAAEGRPPVNSLWFWGQGPLPAKRSIALERVHTRDAMLAGLARHHGVEALEVGSLPKRMAAGELWDLRGFPADRIVATLTSQLNEFPMQWLFEDIDAIAFKPRQAMRFWRKRTQVRAGN